MTEVCSSPSKANDNYKSKMVIRVFIIVFIHITTERNNYFKLKVCVHCLRSFHRRYSIVVEIKPKNLSVD